jgi:predicted phage terminase large subunit-like protein
MSAPSAKMLAALDRDDVAAGGLREFVKLAWAQVEPQRLSWGWHLDAICEHLEAVTRREIRDLVINVPPGCSKSLIASVLWPAWVWTLDPSHRWIVASYSDEVVLRDARKARTLVTGDWFAARWPKVKLPTDASASKAVSSYYTTAGGMRYSTTTRGSVTGQHCDTALVDDPIDPQGVATSTELDACSEWWGGTMSTRFRDHKTSARVLIMQRLHERDLTREFERAGATMLCLPMRHDATHPHRWPRDPRSGGDLLVPDRVPEEELAKIETKLGPTKTAAQMGQRPNPAGGSVFRREWLRQYWVTLPPGGTWAQSWDLAFKGKDSSDYVCGQVWYDHGANHYLVDMVLRRMGFNDTCEAIKALSKRYPRALKKRVEDKANGPAVLDSLRSVVNGLEPVEPLGGKEARAASVEPLFAAGNVFFPHPDRAEYEDGRKGAPWMRGAVPLDAPEAARDSLEWYLVTFPKADHDDAVDALTQHLAHASGGFAAKLRAAVDAQTKKG